MVRSRFAVALALTLLLAPALPAQQVEAPAKPAPAKPSPAKPAAAKPAPARAAMTAGPSCAAIQAALSRRPIARATKGATVEGITEYSFPNGLRVLLFPDQSKPTATVNITYLVGSRHEGYGETGMAHLLEHMVFKGTPCHPNVPQELTAHGARPNGTTWFDRTNYFETFSASDSNLVWALDLEADRMVNSWIAKKDLESEFTVVRNEFESGENDPFGVLMDRTIATAYLWHNYGNSTIGARADIENVPIERLQSFYHRYYQPDNAVLVVAGKFDPVRALALIEQKFSRIPRPDRRGTLKIYPTYTLDPTQDGERSVTLRRVGDVQVAMSVYHVPAGSHPDYAAVDVLSQVLGDAPSGRLYKALVEPKLAADVGAFNFQLKEPGILIAYARVRKEDDLAKARAAMDAALAAAVTTAPTADEVDRARTQLLKNIDLNLNRSDQVGLELSEWASMGDWRLLFIHRDRIKKVSPEDVARVAAAYLKPSNVTTGTFVPTEKPDRAEIPATPDFAALVKDYKGDTALAVGEVFDPSPDNIDHRTTRSTLASGLKLALLPKQNRGQAVNLALTLRFGTLAQVQGKSAAADLAADMLMRGTRTKTRQQIKDEFDRLKARVSPLFASPTQVRVTIETTRPNLVPALRLLGEVLREPSFPEKEFDELKREDLAQFEENRSEPTSQGSIAYQRYLNPYPKGDPRYVPTVDEQVADYTAATLDDARRYYAQFYGASNGELAVVGDFDPAELTAAATEIFGAWKGPQPFARVPQEYKDVSATSITLNTPDKANAFFLAGMNLKVRDDNPDYPALLLGNYMLGGGFLNSRLAVRIRQKEGISYGVGSGLFASALDSTGGFQTFAIYAPENASRLEQAFREEIDRMLKEGFTADEVKAAKTGWLQSRQVGRSQDGQLVNTLGNYAFIGRTLGFDAALEQKVSSLTPDAINTAMRKYIDPTKITIVKAGDFQKKPEPAKP
jgi:zinc protease